MARRTASPLFALVLLGVMLGFAARLPTAKGFHRVASSSPRRLLLGRRKPFVAGAPHGPRRRGLSVQAIETGEWVIHKDTGSKAQVLSATRGWWRIKEEGSDRILSVRSTALEELDQAAPVAGGRAAAAATTSDSSGSTSSSSPSSFEGPRPLFLDASARHPLHAATMEWIVFSDLHCSIQTLPTCREVLKQVHREAQARGAGVIFLGDFFHIRGAIRVDLLNVVMADLGTWTQPVVAIPGNHDQVTLDGTVHALTPLGFAIGSSLDGGGVAQGQAVVVTKPTVFLDALWLPYARDSAVTRALLAPYKAPAEHDDAYHQALVRAVFCHVDVRGAPMNDNSASRRGLRPTVFPEHLPVYSGHFHKPHKVPKTSVTYIGSPYQVSLAEAGQQKRLLVLRRPDTPGGAWTEAGDIRIDVGRRYFRPRSIGAAQDLLANSMLRKGDRVVLNLPESADMAKEVEGLRAQLRATAQAELEVREASPEEEDGLVNGAMDGLLGQEAAALKDVTDYETLGTTAVWRAYMEETMAANKEGSSSSTLEKMLEEGLQMIEAWEISAGEVAAAADSRTTTMGGGSTGMVRLELQKVKASGYGPFSRAVEYPLGGRGLVLLRGKNMDDPGAESNAAGKSKLAMAAQWALTGDLDEKPVMDAKVTDIAFDVSSRGKAAYAEVTLWGGINGVPFEVTRKRGAKTNQVRFVLNGEDLTRQTTKDTQMAMEEALGLDLDFLGLAIFCGQHQMNGLLEATDVRLKERLSKIVRLGVWEDLKEAAKIHVKTYQDDSLTAATQARVHELDLERQELEEAELLEALSSTSSSSSSNGGDGAKLLGGPAMARTLDQVEVELGCLGKQVEEARAAWKVTMERREEWARGQAEAGQSEGIRRERLRTLQVAVEEDTRAVTMLEDRWDPSVYWAELQRWNVVPTDAMLDPARGLAFAAHIPTEEWQAKVQAVETARAKCMADIGAASGDLRKVEGALDSLLNGAMAGEGHEEEGCPTCGRAWDEGGGDAKAKAIAHLRGEIAKCQAWLQEAEEKKPRLDKQKTVLTRIADAHVQYLRDVQDWQAVKQRLAQRASELTTLEKEVAEGTAPPPAFTEEQAQVQPEDELAAREKEFRTLQEQYNQLQDERPKLIQQAAEMKAREKAEAELRARLEKKRAELTKARETLERIRLVVTEQEEKARLYRELVEKFGMRGIQAFVLRGAVAQLERLANRFLALLSEGGLRLGLSLDGEKIAKEVKVRGADGVFHDRSLAHLSGGQWRRASIAALMAFRELSRLRSRVDCNLMVLDEVLNHLDGAGRARVGKLLRAMVQGGRTDLEDGEEEEVSRHANTGIDTAIVILQDLAAFELEDVFDFVDEVVKEGDISRVVIDERHFLLQQQQEEKQLLLTEEAKDEDEDEDEGGQGGGSGGGSPYVLLDSPQEEVWTTVDMPVEEEEKKVPAKAAVAVAVTKKERKSCSRSKRRR